MKKNDNIQGQQICTVMRVYEELIKFIIGPKVKVIGPFHFLRPKTCFGFVWYFVTKYFRII